jgi:hypothetical protein
LKNVLIFEKKGGAEDQNTQDPTKEEDKVEWLDMDRVDYHMCFDAYKGTDLEDIGVPLSYLDVRTVAEGMEWYSRHTKMPDCMIPFLAEYHWGDDKPPKDATVGQPKKKSRAKTPPLSVKHGVFKVAFD